jgi:hypothetical protein
VTMANKNRLSPYSRGEDEGEGLVRPRLESTLTLPLSFQKGEATRRARGHSTIPAQT